MQHQQHHSNNLYRALALALAALVLLAAVLLLAFGRWGDRGQPVPAPTRTLDPELGVPLGDALFSAAIAVPPEMDGIVEAAWEQAQPLAVPLHEGLHGQQPAGTLELRSLYDAERVYFLARWPAAAPGGEPDVWRNLLTVHWRLAEPELACAVSCHTATVDGRGRLIGMRSETIPPGMEDDLPAGGEWTDGTWTIEWSRLRTNENPYDQPLTDPTRNYPFFVKLFLGVEGHPDPISDLHELRFGP